jgi:hypothetical protein
MNVEENLTSKIRTGNVNLQRAVVHRERVGVGEEMWWIHPAFSGLVET